jgi:outer membrane protein OmpA-like peptidoglycan-associated protein
MPWDQPSNGKDKSKKEKKAAKPPMETDQPEEGASTAQQPSGYSPGSGFEVGVRGGLFQILGEIKRGAPDSAGSFSNYGFAGSLRFALDHIFSLRAEFLYGKAAGNYDGLKPSLRGFTSTWMSGSLWGLINLNSLASPDKEKKLAMNLMLGAGANSSTIVKYGTDLTRPTEAATFTRKFDFSHNPFHIGAGFNVAYRVTPNLSIGLEHQAIMAMGERRDLLDGWDNGVENPASAQTDYNDYIGFTNLSLNYIIGNKSGDSPAFWNSPLKNVIREIEGIKSNVGTGGKIPIQDTDKDGVLDEFDLELNTPPNALVDTRGRTLDSDKDGVPDYLDKQPFYAPLAGEQVDADGVIINGENAAGGVGSGGSNPRPGGSGVTEARVKEIVEQAFQQREASGGGSYGGGGAVVEWFLPMIHFDMSSSNIRNTDIGNMSSIARMMKSNKGMKLLVIGYTDKTGGEDINQRLSYQRASAAIDYFVNKQGISRDRFVLNYKGKDDNIVEATSSFMNRRVEFQMAKPGDIDMPAPGGN